MHKIYTCICGKKFSDPYSFNGHKATCEKHHISKYGNLCNLNEHREKFFKGYQTKSNNRRIQRDQSEFEIYTKWVSEKHTCEKCGKVMTEKFGSGRFCSRSCANGRAQSEETKKKIALSVSSNTDAKEKQKLVKHLKSNAIRDEYYKHPNVCRICGKELTYENKHRVVCSDECLRKDASNRAIQRRHNGDLFGGHLNCYKHGTYHDIYCDSSWELAFVVYMIETGHSIKRCKDVFTYTYKGDTKHYFPDFVVDDSSIVEIKNYWTDQVQAKINSIPEGVNYSILYYQDIKPYLDYCENKYGKQFWEKLYS